MGSRRRRVGGGAGVAGWWTVRGHVARGGMPLHLSATGCLGGVFLSAGMPRLATGGAAARRKRRPRPHQDRGAGGGAEAAAGGAEAAAGAGVPPVPSLTLGPRALAASTSEKASRRIFARSASSSG